MNFQAAVTAITGVHLLARQPLDWLEGLVSDIPVAVWSETGGPGDDIRLELESGDIVEAQVKKGLQKGNELWSSLLALGHAIMANTIGYGVLAVSGTSSGTIREDLAGDIRRVGEGRLDRLHDITVEFLTMLQKGELDPIIVCSRLRIPTVHALADDAASIVSAKTILINVAGSQQASAWDRLYREAEYMPERRGRWTLESLSRLLIAAGIQLSKGEDSAVSILASLTSWCIKSNATFTIATQGVALPIDDAWLPLKAKRFEHWDGERKSFDQILQRYRESGQRPTSAREEVPLFDAEWTGFFRRTALVFAGPGMGKTTLMSKLAYRYASEGYPVLKVSLKLVAARMMQGDSFIDSVMHLGLDGSELSPDFVKRSGFREWVLLCDGLDETRSMQESVAKAIVQFAAGHPYSRIVVSSRPVGYTTGFLSHWQQYELLQLAEDDGAENLRILLSASDTQLGKGQDEIRSSLESSLTGSTALIPLLRNPQLLSMAAAVIMRGGELGRTRVQLYKNLFRLLDKSPTARTGDLPESLRVLNYVLDLLCWQIMLEPTATPDDVLEACAAPLMAELQVPNLKAHQIAETCLRHWEQLGILERLHHGLHEVLAASHQTFAEFAAARKLASMSSEQRGLEIKRLIDEPAWFEVLHFAAGLGLADELVQSLISADQPATSAIKRALNILAENATTVAPHHQEMLLRKAFDVIRGPFDSLTFQTGLALADVSHTLPNVGNLLLAELTSTQNWTRAIASLCALGSDGTHICLDEMRLSVDRLLSSVERNAPAGTSTSKADFLPFEMKVRLVLNFIRRIIASWPRPKVDLYLTSLAQRPETSVGLLMEADSYARAQGFRISGPPLLDPEYLKNYFALPEHYRIGKTAELDVLKRTASANYHCSAPASLAHRRPLLYWRALIQATSMLECPVSETTAWLKPTYLEAVDEVIKGLVLLADLDQQQLAADIAQILSDKPSHPYDQIPSMTLDVELNWKRAPELHLDRAKLEQALSHPSPWLVTAATNILAALPPEPIVHLASVLGKTSGIGLGGVAHLLKIHYPGEAAAHILGRLEGPITDGTEALLRALNDLNPPWSNRLAALVARLRSDGRRPSLVQAAAEFEAQRTRAWTFSSQR